MNEVELTNALSPNASKLYLHLRVRGGGVEASNKELADAIGLSTTTITTCKQALIASGLVEVTHDGYKTGYYLPYTTPHNSTQNHTTLHNPTYKKEVTLEVTAQLDPPLDSLHNVKSEATVPMQRGAHVGRVLHAYVAAFPGKPKPSPSQIQQWITAVTVDTLVNMIDKMGGKDIASPIGYVASAVKNESVKRQEQGAPDGSEIEAERERGIALAMMGAKQNGKEIQQSTISERRARKNIQSS